MRKKHVEISFVTLALIIIILAISFLPFGKCQNCDIEETNLKIINVKDWLDLSRSEGVIFLDIRTQEEFEKFHLDGAINLDFYNESYREDLDKLDKSRTYLTYCRSGRRRCGILWPNCLGDDRLLPDHSRGHFLRGTTAACRICRSMDRFTLCQHSAGRYDPPGLFSGVCVGHWFYPRYPARFRLSWCGA